MPEYFDREGQPINVHQWRGLFENVDYKRVAFTELKGCHVSTLWLGLNHAWDNGPPLIFETIIFDGPLDQDMERYSTEEDALVGHERMVTRAKKASRLWWRRWRV